jgi:hypothetical protein
MQIKISNMIIFSPLISLACYHFRIKPLNVSCIHIFFLSLLTVNSRFPLLLYFACFWQQPNILLIFNNCFFCLLQFDNPVFTGNVKRSGASNNTEIPLSNCRFVGHTRTIAVLAVCSWVLSMHWILCKLYFLFLYIGFHSLVPASHLEAV